MPKTAQYIATKVAMDGLIFGPIHLFVFFTYMGLSAGKTIPEVKEDLKRNYFPALVLEGGVWPIVQIFNFRYVPVKYQLLYVNLLCLLDSAFLHGWSNRRMHLGNNGFNHFILLMEKELHDGKETM